MTPSLVARVDANSLKDRPPRVLPALASNKHVRRAGAGALEKIRETIVRLFRESDESICAECVATVVGQAVGAVMMTVLGLRDRFISFQGVCSTCHRDTRVIRQDPGRS